MAVVYFTSNASTGAGSLVEALQNASPGDVVRPDETVFERGATIEIALASTLTIDKNLTLDGGPFRVVLNGDGLARCCALSSGASVEITAFDFVGGGWNSQTGTDVGSAAGAGLNVSGGSSATLNRCGFFGCRGTYGGGIAVGTGSSAELNDCVIVGCYARGSGAGIRSAGDVVINGSTIIGNIAAESTTARDILVDLSSNGRVALTNSVVGIYRGNVEVGAGCVVGVASSALGFVAPPPDDLAPETWTPNAWRNWDLRLLDDASPTPSPYRDSGNVDNMSRYDVQGNFRGRETNGATTCSPGAYETLQADLFWVGVDSNGATVATPSFLSADGWATSRFATASGDAAPQVGQTVFVDGNVHFADVLSTTSAQTFGLAVGGGAVVAIDAASRVYFGELQIALGASFASTSQAQPKTSTRCGAWSRLEASLAAEKPCDFDAESYAANAIFYNVYVPNAATYGALKIATSTTGVIRLSGEYVCDVFSTAQNGTATNQTIGVGDDGATIRARSFQFGGATAADYVESFFDRPVTLKLQGAASVSTPSTSRESWADDFLIDVSDATSATLTLSGQTVYGDAPTAAVSLTGNAKVDERGLDVASLALNADATLTAQNATVNVETLSLNAGSISTVDGGSVDAESLTSTAGSTLTIVGARVVVATLTLVDGANVAFSRTDAVLAATETATVGAATFTGTGYFASPPETDLMSATFTETVRACDYGANVSAFEASSNSTHSALLSWVKQKTTPTVLIEMSTGVSWGVVNNRVNGTSLIVDISSQETFRLFDGENFFTASARPYGAAYELAEDQTIGYLKTMVSTGYLN